MKRKLGQVVADIILYGDVEEAVWPKDYEATANSETYIRQSIAATILKLTRGGEGGLCGPFDVVVAPYLQLEVEDGQTN